MRTVVVNQNQNGRLFQAVSGKNKSVGNTVGEALDALEKQIPNEPNAVIYIQDFQPDEFFTAEQQKRLSELMETLRNCQAKNVEMSPNDREELEALIEAALEGSTKRVAKIAGKLVATK